jgi:hypothetical protein
VHAPTEGTNDDDDDDDDDEGDSFLKYRTKIQSVLEL